MVFCKNYSEPDYCEPEILRYAGCKKADVHTIELLQSCRKEVAGKLAYRVCYGEFSVKIEGDLCDFDVFCIQSKNLADNLRGCQKAVLFVATVGVEMDRLILKYGRLSPAKALMFQAIGAERIEALCDLFCDELKKEYREGIRPRFSPGYGDLSLLVQKDLFSVLDCERKIALTLNESCTMSPSKSVTAIVGIGGSAEGKCGNKCSTCSMKNCTFRGVYEV